MMPFAIAANSVPIIAFAPIVNNRFGRINPLSKMMIGAIVDEYFGRPRESLGVSERFKPSELRAFTLVHITERVATRSVFLHVFKILPVPQPTRAISVLCRRLARQE
jgi:hypothetical protein